MKKMTIKMMVAILILPICLNAFSTDEKVNKKLDDTFYLTSKDYTKCGMYFLIMTKSTKDKKLEKKFQINAKKSCEISYSMLINPLHAYDKTVKKVFKNNQHMASKVLVKEFESHDESFQYLENKYQNVCIEKLNDISMVVEEVFNKKEQEHE